MHKMQAVSITTYIVDGPVRALSSRKSGYTPFGAIYELLNNEYFGKPSEEFIVRKYGLEVTRQELLDMSTVQRNREGYMRYKENGRPYVEVIL